MTEPSSHAVLDVAGRHGKARKIAALLETALHARRGLDLLEIGTGAGGIAHWFATDDPGRYRVSALDVADQRRVHEGYAFCLYDGARLPYADQAFDVVVSNHVIEHVGDRSAQALHLREIARVLRAGGVAYLASPSRWQFIEPHFRLPGLSWMPRRFRHAYVRAAGRGARYDCDPLSHRELERALRGAGLAFVNCNVAALLALREGEGARGLAALAARAPRQWLHRAYRWSPTMVYLASRPGTR